MGKAKKREDDDMWRELAEMIAELPKERREILLADLETAVKNRLKVLGVAFSENGSLGA